MISNNLTNCPSTIPSELEVLKRQNRELTSKIASFEHQRLIDQRKVQALQGELHRLIKENHRLILQIDHQRNQKLNLIQSSDNIRNQLSFEAVEIKKYESQNKRLVEENQQIRNELERLKLEKAALSKQKQNACNKLLVSEAQLQALTMQSTYVNTSLAQLQTQNARLKEEVSSLNKRLSQNTGVIEKTILKDNNRTKNELLSEFQQKMHNKEMANYQQTQKYESKIAQLKLRVAQLESQIVSK